MTNADVIKLAKAGLSEDFILNTIEQQGSRLFEQHFEPDRTEEQRR